MIGNGFMLSSLTAVRGSGVDYTFSLDEKCIQLVEGEKCSFKKCAVVR